MHRTQPEGSRPQPGDTDRTVHSLRRFLRLAGSGNPSVLMAPWAPVLKISPEGAELRQLADAFVGRHVIPRYRGYMRSQALRLLGLSSGGHGRRGGGQRAELIEQFGYDTKYAMHCARLGLQCIELMTTRRLELPIQGEPAAWLRNVRRGEVSFADWWDRVLWLDAELERWQNEDSVPAGPQRARIGIVGGNSPRAVAADLLTRAGDAGVGGRPRFQPRCPDWAAALPAQPVAAVIEALQRRVQLAKLLAGLVEQGGQVLPLEGDSRSFRVMLVVGVRRAGCLDDAFEFPVKAGQPVNGGFSPCDKPRPRVARFFHQSCLSLRLAAVAAGPGPMCVRRTDAAGWEHGRDTDPNGRARTPG